MKNHDVKPLLLAACEALYHLRSIGAKIPPAFAKIHVPFARRALEDAVRLYADLGDSACAADCAKMLMSGTGSGGVAYLAARAEVPETADKTNTALRRAARAERLIEDCLEGAQQADDSLSIFKTLCRFAEFCDRARYAGTFVDALGVEHRALIPDDPLLPVVPWLRKRHCYPLQEDLPLAAELYLAWAEEAARETFGGLSKIQPRNPGRAATVDLVRRVTEGNTPEDRGAALGELLQVCWGSQFAMLDAREFLDSASSEDRPDPV